ncbi:4-hydroxythreonine-4-phosphate dehydrogenase PdxA [Pseudokineococcus sp. 5B2Z-1]|uniref:4-hydroxythreonine-4-phosphate dehydrogenase PdxA n=2 Tax=Pseudokineococcus sp. 5B2Z-1 TaxID=3132744 RepID=UPI0030962E85
MTDAPTAPGTDLPGRPWDAALVADDLTGAGDSAVRFADLGWRTLLAVGADAGTAAAPGGDDPCVLATSTDVRAAAPAVAREVVRRRVAALLGAGTPRVYLKVDSTLRGSVADQVEGALAAWVAARPDGFAVVCPAYPAMGRTVTGGRALVRGRPLEEGPAGSDPVTPVRTSVLAELLPGAHHVPAPEQPDAADAADTAAAALAAALLAAADGGHRLLTVDADDDAALDVVARALVRCDGRALPVGSAGLAQPVARLWREATVAPAPVAEEPSGRGGAERGADGPVLVLVTSLHPVAREQVERLAARSGTVVVRPSADDLASGGRSGAGAGDPAVPDADVVVVLAPEPPADGAAPSARRSAARVATGTAALLERLHDRVHGGAGAAAVVAVGGDGAAALLERWGSTGLEVRAALAEGVPAGVLVGGRAAGLPFASKAGGFGEPGTLVEVVDRLRDARPGDGSAPTGPTAQQRTIHEHAHQQDPHDDTPEPRSRPTPGGTPMDVPVLAVTIGDVAGIGPEITAKTLLGHDDLRAECVPVVLGDAGVMRRAVRDVGGDPDAVRVLERPRDATNAPGVVEVVQVGDPLPEITVGELSPVAGDAAYRFVVAACDLAKAGEVDGIVTAPLNKAAMHAGGHAFPGHTELLAHEFGVEDFSLVLSAGDLYLFHLTTHVSLRQAIEDVTPERTDAVLTLVDAFSRALGRPGERIGVAGLNPHAGENRIFGDEDADVLEPAVRRAQERGVNAHGPLPADALIPAAVKGRWEFVVVCYHDQGHAPFKAVYGDDGVNITVGLPVVRVSVDHGTAFDIAGQGIAREASLVLSCRRAAALAPGWGHVRDAAHEVQEQEVQQQEAQEDVAS